MSPALFAKLLVVLLLWVAVVLAFRKVARTGKRPPPPSYTRTRDWDKPPGAKWQPPQQDGAETPPFGFSTSFMNGAPPKPDNVLDEYDPGGHTPSTGVPIPGWTPNEIPNTDKLHGTSKDEREVD